MMPDYQCVTEVAVASSRLREFAQARWLQNSDGWIRDMVMQMHLWHFGVAEPPCEGHPLPRQMALEHCQCHTGAANHGNIWHVRESFTGHDNVCCQVVQYGGTQSHANRIRLKTEGWSREPYGSEWWLTTEVTLITSVVAAHSLNLAETYSLISPYSDKSDNLHFNGDYHKMLACSHSAYLLLGNWENYRPCCSTPSIWDNKKSKHPF